MRQNAMSFTGLQRLFLSRAIIPEGPTSQKPSMKEFLQKTAFESIQKEVACATFSYC